MTENLERGLGQVEGKLDLVIEKLNDIDTLGKRVTKLENRQYWLQGLTAGVTFFLAKVDLTQVFAIIMHKVP